MTTHLSVYREKIRSRMFDGILAGAIKPKPRPMSKRSPRNADLAEMKWNDLIQKHLGGR